MGGDGVGDLIPVFEIRAEVDRVGVVWVGIPGEMGLRVFVLQGHGHAVGRGLSSIETNRDGVCKDESFEVSDIGHGIVDGDFQVAVGDEGGSDGGEGDEVGATVGIALGTIVGDATGDADGVAVGLSVGNGEGAVVGDADGTAVGESAGDAVGLVVGARVFGTVSVTRRDTILMLGASVLHV